MRCFFVFLSCILKRAKEQTNKQPAGLSERVTDRGLRALAAAGCGANLKSLAICCACLFVFLLRSCSFSPNKHLVNAGLKRGVTDQGLCALAAAGCGTHLMSLTLDRESFSLPKSVVLSCQPHNTAQDQEMG